MQKYYVVVYSNGDICWHSDPECIIFHRENGPAIENTDGYEAYYQNNKWHRIDGPARIWRDGGEEYWIEGVHYSKEEFLAKTQPVKELTVSDIEKLLGYRVKIVK